MTNEEGDSDHLLLSVPCPNTGTMYTPKEVVQLLSTASGKSDRAQMMSELLALEYVPIKRVALYKLWDKRGDLPVSGGDQWNLKGIPPILDQVAIDLVADKHMSFHGRAFTE